MISDAANGPLAAWTSYKKILGSLENNVVFTGWDAAGDPARS
jgi:hypothetical protein